MKYTITSLSDRSFVADGDDRFDVLVSLNKREMRRPAELHVGDLIVAFGRVKSVAALTEQEVTH